MITRKINRSRLGGSAHKRRLFQKGLTLVELMISMTLGLIVVAGLTTMFVNVSRSNQEMARTNSQIENARFAMQFLQDDIIHAGFWKSFTPQFDDLSLKPGQVPTDVPSIIPDPCLAFTTPWDTAYIDSLMGIPIQVYTDLPAACTTTQMPDKAIDTDVLVVRHANNCAAGAANCEEEVAGKLYFQTSNCALELDGGFPYRLATTDLDLHERDCEGSAGSPPAISSGTIAEKRKFIQSIYYVRDYGVTPGDGIPTLVRSQFDLDGGSLAQQPPVELVQGIERFRVELAFDNKSDSNEDVDYTVGVEWADTGNRSSPRNRGDGIPDGLFVHCPTIGCTAIQLADTVAVKLYILARADQRSLDYTDRKSYTMGSLNIDAFNDEYKRHVFSSSMRLHNIAGRRETPP